MNRHSFFKGTSGIIGPLLIILLCMPIVILVWYTNTALNGSIESLYSLFLEQGVFSTVLKIWKPLILGTPEAWKIVITFTVFQLLLMKILPGKRYEGLLTPQGSFSVYRANGVLSYGCTLLFYYLGAYPLKLFSPTLIYDHFGGLLGTLNLFSLVFCLLLFIKGRCQTSKKDVLAKGNSIKNYFWGTELYPRIFGLDVKLFTNCRFGIMGWALITLSFGAKQSELYGLSDAMLVSVLLQLLYIAKFFCCEQAYVRSMDILYDRMGFCVCWGAFVWLPAIYSSCTLFMVHHPRALNPFVLALILGGGIFCTLINCLADRQRLHVRHKKGACTVWKKHPELIFANYMTEWGEEKQNLLLASGWWGISRHFRYLPEIFGAFLWSVPAGFSSPLPYVYVIFLTLLLIDRAYRKEKHCHDKYGKDWEKYCERVPFRFIPFIY